MELPPAGSEESVWWKLEEISLQELAAGATAYQVVDNFAAAGYRSPGEYHFLDVTSDGNPELLLWDSCSLSVVGCREGEYTQILEFPPDPACLGGLRLIDVIDINRNGAIDLILEDDQSTGVNNFVQIFEWDGTQFKPLVKTRHSEDPRDGSRLERGLFWYEPFMEQTTANGHAPVVFRDLDSNGVKEMILDDSGPVHWDTVYNFGPWRGKISVFTWDGLH